MMVTKYILPFALLASFNTSADSEKASFEITEVQKPKYLNIPLKSKLYFGLALGRSQFDFDHFDSSWAPESKYDQSNNDTGLKLTLGYELNQYIGVETSYQYFGDSFYLTGVDEYNTIISRVSDIERWGPTLGLGGRYSDTVSYAQVAEGVTRQSLDGLSLDLVLSLPLNGNYAFYLKAGYLSYQYKYAHSSTYQNIDNHQDMFIEDGAGSSTDWLRQGSVGLSYQLDYAKVSLEYQKLGNGFPNIYSDISSINIAYSVYY